jgi:sarcosine oxidase subunit alpha
MSSSQTFRLAAGGAIDRGRPIQFRFEGRSYQGYGGDTLASALMANGVRVMGRSVKYHRPRGLLAAGAEEPNVLVRVGEGAQSTVNLRATEVLLREGLVASPVNCWPSARFDLGAVNNLLSAFLSAGFYYKTFMWPTWHLFEGSIRRMAGLGKPSSLPDPDFYEPVYAHCDVLVIGAGPAGLAAARSASAGGARVILAEQDFALGGRLLWDGAQIDGIAAAEWIARTEAEIRGQTETRVLLRTTALGYFDLNAITLVERVGDDAGGSQPRERMWQVRAKRVILATGALERPLVFPGNDQPGVMLSSAVRQYVRRFGVRAANRAVVFTNNDDAYATAIALNDAGIDVACVADVRATPPTSLTQALRARGIPVVGGAEVIATQGSHGLRAVSLQIGGGGLQHYSCDLLAMSGGFNPATHLFTQSGGTLDYDEALACFVPAKSAQAEISVGGARADWRLSSSLKAGHEAGRQAAAIAGFSPADLQPPSCAIAEAALPIEPYWGPGPGKGKAFVDFQNDVTVADVVLSARENYVSVEHLKRYTTLGMAADQGKTSNVNALAIMAGLTGRRIVEAGTTRNRFPYTPVSIGAFGGLARGARFRPFRQMPLHAWHAAQAAVFEDYGGWMRPAYYPNAGESAHAAEQREARTVRTAVGLFEGTPLGKIEVRGPDAAKFLDRVYANTMSTLKPGKLRYGLMLNELGVVIDDGVVARFAEDHFLVGTTGSGASRIAGWLEEWLQCEWPDLDVVAIPVTSSWAVLTLTGPKARDVLASVGTDIDLAPDSFPHMSLRTGTVGGVPARIFRVSFTGEVSYEINVPAREARRLWETLMTAGAALGIAPVGIDAWMLLRTEKGYLHVGADTDGTTVPDDVGWGHVARKAGDFIGKRSLSAPGNVQTGRLQLVGLKSFDSRPLPLGAHLITDARSNKSEGYITSSGFSPSLGCGVALAMLEGGRARLGETLNVVRSGEPGLKALVAPQCAYDAKGEKLNA